MRVSSALSRANKHFWQQRLMKYRKTSTWWPSRSSSLCIIVYKISPLSISTGLHLYVSLDSAKLRTVMYYGFDMGTHRYRHQLYPRLIVTLNNQQIKSGSSRRSQADRQPTVCKQHGYPRRSLQYNKPCDRRPRTPSLKLWFLFVTCHHASTKQPKSAPYNGRPHAHTHTHWGILREYTI